MRIWWKSVLLSEHAGDRSYEPLLERARNAKSAEELSEALLEAHKHAYHQDDPQHPIHRELDEVIHHHAQNNPSLLRRALSSIARPSPHHSEYHTHALGILERTPTLDALEYIGKYAKAGNMNAYHAAHGWIIRHPDKAHYFRDYILPHLNNELERGWKRSWHPYLRFLKEDAEHIVADSRRRRA
jgi:hypothetical protein